MASKMTIKGCDVPLCDTVRPENEDNCFPYSFKEKKRELLPKGWQKTPRSRPLPGELVYEVDEEMRHSDGVKSDLLRRLPPEDDDKDPSP
ncbi:hypothetical protein CTRI78_v001701 [Colletotrichum trifolii]|uniref:Uncharacterized protein n=1 Tax=Colletotrichum trifolii TaxID=5466 RepID=A0A4R8RNL8_COLTR|nr:hypothetical protein CTRI78_v001701 [Colletotrichum trifolii]